MKRSKLTFLMILSVLLMATTVFGQTWWVYSQLGNSAADAVKEIEDGYVHCGITFNVPRGGAYLSKSDKQTEQIIWYRYYPSLFSQQTCGWDLVPTPGDNGFAILAQDDIGFGWCMRLIKTNMVGDTIWNRYFSAPAPANEFDPPYYFSYFSPNSGFVLGANRDNYPLPQSIFLIRTTSSGDTLWTRNIAPDTHHLDIGIYDLTTRDNKIFLLGNASVRASPTGGPIWRTLLAEISENGQIVRKTEYFDPQWQTGIHFSGIRFFHLENENSFLVVGFKSNRVLDSVYLFLLKVDSSQNQLWQKLYNFRTLNLFNAVPRKIWQRGNSIYIPLIATFGDAYTERQLVGLIKTDINGNFISFDTFPHPTYGEANLRDAIPASDNSILFAGRVPPAYGHAFLMKLPLAGLEESQTVNLLPSLIRVFPNPSTGWINFQISNGKNEILKIYDVTGKLVREVEIRNKIQLQLKAGIYFFRLCDQKGKVVILGQ